MKKIIILFCLIIIVISCTEELPRIKHDTQNSNISITTYGSANQVSGSITKISYEKNILLVDCGTYYTDSDDNELSLAQRQKVTDNKNQTLPVDASKIDAVFITHAHLDHCGRLPLLFKYGFNGDVYVSPGTMKLLPAMIQMQLRYDNSIRNWVFSKKVRTYDGKKKAKVHWYNCKWQNKISPNNKVNFHGKLSDLEKEKPNIDYFSPCKVCAEKQLAEIASHIKIIKFNEEFRYKDNIVVKFTRTGHIPGSSAIMFTFCREDSSRKVIFSGDVGNSIEILYPKPSAFEKSDIVILESTYGNILRAENQNNEEDKFVGDLCDAIKNNQLVWIPSFALDRTQKMLYEIARLRSKHPELRNVPVYCPSPSANKLCKIYQSELDNNELNWFKDEIYEKYGSSNLFIDFIEKIPNQLVRPSIVITTSGMMDEAYSKQMMKEVEDEETSIFIVSYQDPGAPGGFLKSGQNEFIWDDKTYTVKANILSYNCFSSHLDFKETLEILRLQNKDSVEIYLNHGNKNAIDNKTKEIYKSGYRNVNGLNYGGEITISF